MIQLRNYQLIALNEVLSQFAKGVKNVCLVLPTGAGKTTVAAEIIKRSLLKNKRILFLAHRQELIFQCKRRLMQFNIESDILLGSKSTYTRKNIIVASVQTLNNRELENIDFIITDECHHAASRSYKNIYSRYPNAYHLGLTATPYRSDNKGLLPIFQALVQGVTIYELITEGFLVETECYANKSAEMDNVKVVKGDFDNKQMFDAFDKPVLYSAVIENYIKYSNNKKCIVFCVNVLHSKNTVNIFQEKGILAAHIDCETDDKDRQKILSDFAYGDLKVLCNVGILTEGYDMPEIECVILNRATKSKSLFVQMVGRGIRAAKNKEKCIVIDHGENISKRFGFIENISFDELQDDKKKKKGVPPVKNCPKCDALLHVRVMKCKCGYTFESKEKEFKEEEFIKLSRFFEKKDVSIIEQLEKERKLKNYKEFWTLHQLAKKLNDRDKAIHIFRIYKGYKPAWEFYIKQNM